MTKQIIALIVLSIGLAGSMWSQTLGSIIGEVKDASGAVAPNVKVTAINTGTGVSRETVTNTVGLYTFPALVPGTYTVKAAAPGFQPMQRSNVELQVQQTANIDFRPRGRTGHADGRGKRRRRAAQHRRRNRRHGDRDSGASPTSR
jgi:hypothetical protein